MYFVCKERSWRQADVMQSGGARLISRPFLTRVRTEATAETDGTADDFAPLGFVSVLQIPVSANLILSHMHTQHTVICFRVARVLCESPTT